MIVVDTNVVGYHLLRTAPFAEEVRDLAEQNPDWIAPPLLRNELRNLLTLQHRERDLPLREAKKLAGQAEALFENALLKVELATVFDLVEQSTLSAYDCEYVALAQRVNTPLVTYDADILDDFPTTAYQPSDLLNE